MEKRMASKKFDSKARSNFQEFWKNKLFCDFTIIVEGVEFQVHKLMLASHFDYFKNMFSHETIETTENKNNLDQISTSTIESLLTFCYSSILVLDEENIQDLYIAANRYQMKEVEEICCEYIKDIINQDNCLNFHIMALEFNLIDLKQLSFIFCLENFDKIVDQMDFLQLDEKVLVSFISSDEVMVESEEKLFNALLKWISYDKASRVTRIEDLIVHIRFIFIDPTHITQSKLSSHEYIYNSTKCCELIKEAKDFIISRRIPKSIHQPRKSMVKSGFYVVDGQGRENHNSVESYDPNDDKWTERKPSITARCLAEMAIYESSSFR